MEGLEWTGPAYRQKGGAGGWRAGGGPPCDPSATRKAVHPRGRYPQRLAGAIAPWQRRTAEPGAAFFPPALFAAR